MDKQLKFFVVLNSHQTYRMGYILDVYPDEIASHPASLRARGNRVIGPFDEEEAAFEVLKHIMENDHG